MSDSQINDFSDVNEGEKAIMNMWNRHIQLNPISGEGMLPQCLEDFIQQHGLKIHRQNLYKNFVLHLTCLHDFHAISSSTMMNTITKYQTLVKETIENPEKYPITPPKMPIKNPYYKPKPVPLESLNSTSNLSDPSSEMISNVAQETPSVSDFVVEDFDSTLQDGEQEERPGCSSWDREGRERQQMSENGEGTWNCTRCTYTNVAKNYKCDMCYKIRPDSTPAAAVLQRRSEQFQDVRSLCDGPSNEEGKEIQQMSENGEGTWNCCVCTYRNVAKDYKCAMCHQPKSSFTRKSRLAQEKMTADEDKISPIKTSVFYGKRSGSVPRPAAAVVQRRRHSSSGQNEVNIYIFFLQKNIQTIWKKERFMY